jgi:8-oxo-dGTP pyrophosphatase MutT (NUDIX family)
VGGYVMANLKQLREARKLSYRELSDELTRLGRPVPTLGLARIERGERRVDADDLVALAIALRVNPTALLLPRDRGQEDEVELTPAMRRSMARAWRWMDGAGPLPNEDDRVSLLEIVDFATNGRPKDAPLPEAVQELVDRHGERAAPRTPQPVITAIVTSDRGVLVTRRQDGTPPWGFVAGWGEPGESAADTIIREAKEEADLRIEVGEYLGERDHPLTGHHMIYYAARPTHGTEIYLGDKGELTEVRWVSLAEADELMGSVPGGIYGPVREYLARELGES